LTVNWVGCLVLAGVSVAAYFATLVFGERILPFLLFGALPLSFFLVRRNAAVEPSVSRAGRNLAQDLDGERPVSHDKVEERATTNE